MSVIIINSLFVFVAFCGMLMLVYLIVTACAINKEEQKNLEELAKADEKFRDLFDRTDLKK